ncbi:hypothetical protein Q3G72_024947 [Acer saccharum]|nr:hypothetical protein Q3G72_024947 [Acer saccharum]
MESREDLSWVEFGVVGVLKNLKPVSRVCERLAKMGVSFELNYLGGLKLLWFFRSEEDHKDFLIHRFLWEDVLEYVEDKGNSFRLMIFVDDRASLKGSMDSYWILVAMAEDLQCPSLVVVETDYESFRVDVHEVSEGPFDEWFREMLGLSPNIFYPHAPEKGVSSMKVASRGKLVIFKNKGMGRATSDGTVGRYELVNSRYGTSKRKSPFVSFKKAATRPREGGMSGVVVGKEIRGSESSSEYSLSFDGESASKHVNQSRHLLMREGSGGPAKFRLGQGVCRADKSKNQESREVLGQNLGDPIADSQAALPLLGHCLISPNELYVDLGIGLNIGQSSLNVQELSSSSNGEDGEGAIVQGKDSDVNRCRSSYRRARERGRRRAGILSSHGIQTKRSSQQSAPNVLGGFEWEFDDEFAKVKKIKKKRGSSGWRPPWDGSLKFNVDGSFRGNPRPSDIGGLLRNKDGVVLYLFSSCIRVVSSVAAEIADILKACQCVDSEKFPIGRLVVIESDSLSAVSWVNGVVGVGNVRFVEAILEIREILCRLKPRVTIRFISRSGNAVADFLAKQGAVNSLDQLAWVS